MRLHIIIDGDAIIWRAASAVEHKTYVHIKGDERVEYPKGTYKRDIQPLKGWKLVREHSIEPVSHALHIVNTLMERIFTQVLQRYPVGDEDDVTHVVALGDPANNFRKAIDPSYKANRTQDKPIYYQDVRDYLLRKYMCLTEANLEGDDVVAAEQAECQQDPTITSVIVGVDKDLLQIPGIHFNFAKQEFKLVSPFEAAYNFAVLMLIGDTSDNIPGLYRVGPAKAKKVLPAPPTDLTSNLGEYISTLDQAVLKTYIHYFKGDVITAMEHYNRHRALLQLRTWGLYGEDEVKTV